MAIMFKGGTAIKTCIAII